MKKRIEWLDFGKGVTISCVLLGHVITAILTNDQINLKQINLGILSYFNYIIFLMIMPVFFAISGFLYKPSRNLNDIKIKLQRKFVSLFFPYLIISLIYILMSLFSGNTVQGANGINSIFTIWYSPLGSLWYLYVLLAIFIISDILIFFIKTIQHEITLLIVCMLTGLLIQESVVSKTLTFLVCFHFGYLIKKYSMLYKIDTAHYKILLAGFAISSFIPVLMQENWSMNSNQFSLYNLIPKLVIIPVALNLFIQVEKNSCLNSIFKLLGRESLIIYLVHVPAILILERISYRLNIDDIFISLLVYLIGSLFICLIFIWMAKRVKLIDFLFYPGKYIFDESK